MPADVDIVIRTYARDFPWLKYCLRSVERYCQGFRRVTVVVPESSRPAMSRMDRPDHVVFTQDFRDDYLGQQVTKLTADLLSDAEVICHVDADCIFDRPFTPADLVGCNGALMIPITPYATLGRSVPWRSVTERFLGFPVAYDYMRALPLAYPRWLYQELRDFGAHLHGVSVVDYVLAQPPRAFSEFNALGGYAHRFHPEAFEWRVTDDARQFGRHCRWYWSWGGLDGATRRQIEAILAGDDWHGNSHGNSHGETDGETDGDQARSGADGREATAASIRGGPVDPPDG